MSSKYPRSVRCCLPLWALTLEAALILLFFFFTYYDASLEDQKGLVASYQVCQDLTVMAVLGLGFFTSNLRRNSWSSVAFNLFLLALGVQWVEILSSIPTEIILALPLSLSIRLATRSTMSMLISMNAVLGKVNLVQLVVMELVELTVFGTMRIVINNIFKIDYGMNMMHIHVFAAYFGLTVAWCLPKPLLKGTEDKYQTTTSPSLFAMLGTLFLWMFWPTFNSALLLNPIERKNAVFSTYYALAVSAVTAISVSSLAHPRGKINMTYMHNAALAGGVALSASCHVIHSPWIAMVLGLVAGLISIGGAKCLPVIGKKSVWANQEKDGRCSGTLPGLVEESGFLFFFFFFFFLSCVGGMIGFQVLLSTGTLSLAMAMSITSGLLTGLLLNLKIWKGPHVAKYFDDQAFWEFPHLAVGF
ncbi:hypothetical protein EGK_00394 [Macaca mulatta]|uniref:RH-like protein n=1 Tax=Macaca mulatta TaxID=9544 RepID=G7MHP6_MACMU|nr:hypothetical protein EGK_00394 [Macaca mulatta]